jgi:hypothetical protein
MSLLIALALAQVQVEGPARPLRQPVPATDWSCTFEGEDGGRFRLSGRLTEIPAGWDPNRSRPTQVEGEGSVLPGRASAISVEAGEHFRDYQIGIVRGAETYYVNLKLRRGGAGIGYLTHYVSSADHQPYSYIAAGLCTSQFNVAAQGGGQ